MHTSAVFVREGPWVAIFVSANLRNTGRGPHDLTLTLRRDGWTSRRGLCASILTFLRKAGKALDRGPEMETQGTDA